MSLNVLIGQVPQSDVGPVVGAGEGKRVRFESWWMNFFTQAQAILFAVQQSGTTANRPTKLMWLGRTYFDTDLGIPIWVQQVTPTVVWCDATGAPV